MVYLHKFCHKIEPNLGKYTSPMDPIVLLIGGFV